MDGLGISLHVEDGLHGGHGFECAILEDFLANFVPEIFFGVELGPIGRKKQQRDLAGNDEVAIAVIERAVEYQQNVLMGDFLHQNAEEGLEICRIQGWHDQIDTSAVLGRGRAVQVDVFADELGAELGPGVERCSAAAVAGHEAEVGFVTKHDTEPQPSPEGGPPGFSHIIRKAHFLKSFCTARPRLG